jgi:hypothetical protein
MDFSTSTLALKSLQRRKPSLSAKTQAIGSALLPLITQTNNIQSKEALTPSHSKLLRHSILDLLSIGSDGDTEEEADVTCTSAEEKREQRIRWEPLAVGFHLSAVYLEHLVSVNTQSLARPDDEPKVYMDGPRVPSLVTHAAKDGVKISNPAGSSEPEATTLNQKECSPMETSDLQSLKNFCQRVQGMCLRHLEHDEPRVRTLVAKVVGEYTRLATTAQARNVIDSAQIFYLHDTITSSLYRHLTQGRDPITTTTTATATAATASDTVNSPSDEAKPLTKYSTTSTGALDDTTGWRALETNLYGLCSFIRASSFHYFAWRGGAELEQLLQAVETSCIDHINRHVRAAGLALLEQLVHASRASFATTRSQTSAQPQPQQQAPGEEETIMKALVDSDSNMRRIIVKVLKISLADNWSQVRMAASVLCRVFYTTLLDYRDFYFTTTATPTVDTESWFTSTFPPLLPRMCLNRFYLAQGVKLYSHETWRILLTRLRPSPNDGSQDPEGNIDGEQGMALVANYAGPVCRYYVQMCDADNHVVREGACQAVAELANKLGTRKEYCDFLAPFVPVLLQVSFRLDFDNIYYL